MLTDISSRLADSENDLYGRSNVLVLFVSFLCAGLAGGSILGLKTWSMNEWQAKQGGGKRWYG